MKSKVLRLSSILLILLFDGVAFGHSSLSTFRDTNGFSHTCFAPHQRTGENVPVIGKIVVGGNFEALASHDPNGNPVILFNKLRISSMPGIIRQFIYYRECAHLRLGPSNEVDAYCGALRHMRLEGSVAFPEEKIIVQYFNSSPSYSSGPYRMGKPFWKAIQKQCATDN